MSDVLDKDGVPIRMGDYVKNGDGVVFMVTEIRAPHVIGRASDGVEWICRDSLASVVCTRLEDGPPKPAVVRRIETVTYSDGTNQRTEWWSD